MATKKDSTPVLEEPVKEDAELEAEAAKPEEMTAVAKMRAEMERLLKEKEQLQQENEELKKNSVASRSPFGADNDYSRVMKACEEAAQKDEDPWGITISVNAPRIGKGEDSYWLSVNGRSMQVPANDRYYELALPFAQCLVDEIRSRHRAEDYTDSIQVYDPIVNPKPTDKQA